MAKVRHRELNLREGHVLVLILVSATVDKAEDSPNSLRVERKRIHIYIHITSGTTTNANK
jgi:hypothetical protein